ncbi:SSI family serine proteinase inhibitor [Saccharopolyspora sp. 5N708]|uniref:SSI family serine proteinase inhibitor n=1 Tax=Saccharopolyspora sp. 5N708 TaxID=3457424 RepID=UPI003FD05CC8
MLTKLARRVLLASALIVGTALVPSTAAVASAEGGPSVLRLSITTRTAAPSTTVLQCHPVGGTHKHAAQACTLLDEANGNLNLVDADPTRACTMEYNPIKATAVGRWHGLEVRFEQEFPNRCVLTAKTGVVFNL